MRPTALATIAVGALLLVGGCSGDDTAAPPAKNPTSSSPADGDACAEVRAGIDAFNEGDYAETVARFRKAVPLAEDAADDDDSSRADDLLEAVKYYADLAPDDYPESARSSPEFAKYKAITLGQCVPVEQPGDEEPDVET